MGAAYFYHLTRRPLEQTLSTLLAKAEGAGWRVLIRGTDPLRLAWLDEKLWLGPEDGFLPHGLAGGPHDAAQPVLLTDRPGNANAAQCLMCIDSAETTPAEIASFERVCILFDGHDETALSAARAQWKALTNAGSPAQYWSEDTGRWEKKAEHPPP